MIYSDDETCRDLGISNLTVIVQFLPCPVGFELSQQNTTCVCHSPLQQYTNSCDIDTQTIQRYSDFWFNYENASLSLHPHCPFDYNCKSGNKAIKMRITDSSKQRAHNRQATLWCLQNQFEFIIWKFMVFALQVSGSYMGHFTLCNNRDNIDCIIPEIYPKVINNNLH